MFYGFEVCAQSVALLQALPALQTSLAVNQELSHPID